MPLVRELPKPAKTTHAHDPHLDHTLLEIPWLINTASIQISRAPTAWRSKALQTLVQTFMGTSPHHLVNRLGPVHQV